MSIILILFLGGIAGWLASWIVNRDNQGVLVNIVIGVIGAALANWVIAPWLGVPAELDKLSLSGFIVAVLGAVALLVVINLFRYHSWRRTDGVTGRWW